MAEQLIESLTTEFDLTAYSDEYREQLLALIERKAEGKEVLEAPETEAPKPTAAPDLMSALEESIAAVKERKGGKRKRKRAAARKKPKPRKNAFRQKSQSLEIGRGR